MGVVDEIETILRSDNLDNPIFGIKPQLESWVDELSFDGWSNYGDYGDFSNPFPTITIGNGTLVAKWWTPQRVAIAFDTPPFLVHVYASLKFGSTTTVDDTITFRLPTGLVGGFEIDPFLEQSNSGSPDDFSRGAVATAQAVIAGLTNGRSVTGLSVDPLDATKFVTAGEDLLTGDLWDATTPGVWAEGSTLTVQTSFLGGFYGD